MRPEGKIAAFLFLSLLLCISVFSLSSLATGSFVDGSLPASIKYQDQVNFSSIDGAINFSAKITNPQDGPIALYIMEKKGGTLEVVQEAGTIAPQDSMQIAVGIKTKYKFLSEEGKTYALVGVQKNGNALGRYFSLKISWAGYENSIRSSLAYANNYLLPILGLLIIILIAVLLEIAHHSESNPEYSLRTLFFPIFQGRPIGERIADILTDPFFWIFETACICILLASIYNNITEKVGAETGLMIVILSGIGALVLPLLYIAIARLSEKYEKKPMRFFFGLFMWGGFSAFLSFVISYAQLPIFNALGLGATAISFSFFATAMLAPIIEELVKGLGILVASWHHEFDDTLSGLLFGFTVGVGFSFVENWFYFTSRTNPFELGAVGWGSLVLYRSFFNSIAHGCFTAATAAAIGYIKSHPKASSFARLGILPGLFAAIVLHVIFNISALLDGFVIATYEAPVFIFNPALVAAMSIMFLAVYVSATREEKIRYLGRRAKNMVTSFHI